MLIKDESERPTAFHSSYTFHRGHVHERHASRSEWSPPSIIAPMQRIIPGLSCVKTQCPPGLVYPQQLDFKSGLQSLRIRSLHFPPPIPNLHAGTSLPSRAKRAVKPSCAVQSSYGNLKRETQSPASFTAVWLSTRSRHHRRYHW